MGSPLVIATALALASIPPATESVRDTLDPAPSASTVAADSIPPRDDPGTPAPWIALLQTRDRLADRGLRLRASHVADASGVAARTDARDATALRGLVGLVATVDLEVLLGIPGASLVVEHQSLWGEDGSAVLESLQGFSSIDADGFRGFGTVHVGQSILDDRVRWQAGRLDANAEFATSETAGGFLNPALGLTPTMSTAPTYPAPAPGATLAVDPGQRWGAAAGVYRAQGAGGDPDATSALLVGESRLRWSGPASGRLAAGAWHHGAPERPGQELPALAGWYLILDQVLWSGAGDRAVAAFAQVAGTSATTGPVQRHLSGGLVGRGLLGAPGQELGLAATWVRPDGVEVLHAERIVEAYS